MTPENRELYVNQDYVSKKYVLLDPDIFSSENSFLETYSFLCIKEYGTDGVLDYLTHKQREAIILYYIDGKTQNFIASELKISQQAVHNRIRGTEKKLRKRMENKDSC